jgi:hypothetical protein
MAFDEDSPLTNGSVAFATTRKRPQRVFEVASSGIDEFLQGVGGDPYGGSSSVGLRVPTLATLTQFNRYLFLLASFSVAESVKAIIRGYRLLETIGKNTGSPSAPRYVEQEVTTPMWRLPDGNVSFHLHRLGPPNSQGFPRAPSVSGSGTNLLDLRSFVHNFADGPALLYGAYTITPGDTFYTHLTGYLPPNGGKPWGTPLRAGQQGTFYDLRTPWRTHGAWSSLNIELDGPDTIALFASVRQTGGAVVTPNNLAGTPNSMPEEQFLAAYGPGVVYWRVGGALMVEIAP